MPHSTYFLLAVPFVGFVVLLDLVLLRTRALYRRQTWYVMAILLVMTACFDNILTGLPIVTYTQGHILGIRLGYAPIEDFSYTIAAVIGIGSIITYGERKKETR